MNFVNTRTGGGSFRPKFRRCDCILGSGVHHRPGQQPFFFCRSGMDDGGCWFTADGRGVSFHHARIGGGWNDCGCRSLGGRRFYSAHNRGLSGELGFLKASVTADGVHAGRRALFSVLSVLREHGCGNRVCVCLARGSSVRLVRGAGLAGHWISDGRRRASRGVAGQSSTVLPPSIPSSGCGGGFVEGEKP